MEARLKRLERINKILFAGLALALLPWIVGAAEKIPDLVEAANGKFTSVSSASVNLLDEGGNKSASLSGKKDDANLTIRDSNGKTRLYVGMLKGGPRILFADKDGRVVASYAEVNGQFETVK